MSDLSRLTPGEIDALPFGYIGLSPEGTIRKYNRYEADLARTDPELVLGQNFFRDVAPCTQVKEFEGRFLDFASGRIAEQTMAFDFAFKFRHGAQKVRIGLVRTPLADEIIVTVVRVRDVGISLSPEIGYDLERRLLSDANGARVIATGGDFWRSLDTALGGTQAPGRSETLRRTGYEWGLSHALRVEALVQNQLQLALRETELHVALEYLAGSIGVLGMGRFELDLSYRRRGLMIVTHFDSPAIAAGAGKEPCCALLEGLHAGLLSHLAGRRLSSRELTCSRTADEPCRFVVATESRLQNLLTPSPGSADADLLISLGVRPPANR